MHSLDFKLDEAKLTSFKNEVSENLNHHGIKNIIIQPLDGKAGEFRIQWEEATGLARFLNLEKQRQERVHDAVVKHGGKVEPQRDAGIFASLFRSSAQTTRR